MIAMLKSLHDTIKAAILTLMAGVVYLAGGYQYAKVCFAAPSSPGGGMSTIIEVVTFIPAIVFTGAGVIGLIAGVVMLINHLCPPSRY